MGCRDDWPTSISGRTQPIPVQQPTVTEGIREELADYLATIDARGPVIDGILTINARSLADAILASPVIARILVDRLAQENPTWMAEHRAEVWWEGFKAGRYADHRPENWPKNPYSVPLPNVVDPEEGL
jgi:hypothetical protein